MNETKAEEMVRNEVGASEKTMTDDQLAEVCAGKNWQSFLFAMSRYVDESDDPRYEKIRNFIKMHDYLHAQLYMIQLMDAKDPKIHELVKYL